MKYLLTALIVLFAVTCTQGQKMRISARMGSTANRLIITVRSETAFNGKLDEFGVAMQIPKQHSGGQSIALPSVSVGSSCISCMYSTFPVVNWQQSNDVSSDPDWYLFKIGAVADIGAPVITMTAGETRDVVELVFQNSTALPVDVRLAHLANGGPNTMYGTAVLAGGADVTNYVQLFYGAVVHPVVPYNDETTGYAHLQYYLLSGISLPVKWLSFQAVRKNNDAVLNWKVAGEENNHHYEVQRSIDGMNYMTIDTLDQIAGANSVNNYQYTDRDISLLNVATIYYRVKNVGVDGKSSLSQVRTIGLDIGDSHVSVFPNPVREGFYVRLNFETPNPGLVKLVLVGNNGQNLMSKEFSAVQAGNYYFETRSLRLSPGLYHLQIFHKGRILETKKLVIVN